MTKKVEIKYEDFPSTDESHYLIRARVASLDENRTSHWVYFKVPNYRPEDTFNSASGGTPNDYVDYLNRPGETWRTHTFLAPGGTFTTDAEGADNPFTVLCVAGGNGANYYVGEVNPGGDVKTEEITLQPGTSYTVTVGYGGSGGQNNKQPGQPSYIESFIRSEPGQTTQPVASDITNSFVNYGGNSNLSGTYGRGGNGAANSGQSGQNGIIVIAYRIS